MPDGLQKASAGDPIKLSADAWNSAMDAAADFQRRQFAGDAPDADAAADPAILRVKNNSGSDVPRFGVLALTGQGPLITPAARLAGFQQLVCSTGIAPVGAGESVVILLEPIPSGLLGDAVATGVAQVQVNITDAAHTYATSENAHTDRLTSQSGADGGMKILWRETGTGVKWAQIVLPKIIAGAGGSVTVQAVDGSPSFSGSTILFDELDGFDISSGPRVDMKEATASQAGIVSTAAQTMGGVKDFSSGIGALSFSFPSTAATYKSTFGLAVTNHVANWSAFLYDGGSGSQVGMCIDIWSNSGATADYVFGALNLAGTITPGAFPTRLGVVYDSGGVMVVGYGKTGVDPVGNVFKGGMLFTLGTGIDGGTW